MVDNSKPLPQCAGMRILMNREATESIIVALRDYAHTLGGASAERLEQVAIGFETLKAHSMLEVRPGKVKDKEPDSKMPEWDYKDEIIERQLRCIRKIAYSIGQIRGILAAVEGLNALSAVRNIEDSVGEALDARRLVILEVLGADCEVPTLTRANLASETAASKKD